MQVSKNNKDTHHMWALISLIVGAVAIGFAPIFVRLSSVGPLATGFWRVALALPVLILLSFVEGGYKKVHTGIPFFSNYGWILFAGVLFALDLSAWHLSLHYTTVANATLLVNLSPVLMLIWGWLVLRAPLRRNLVFGLLLTLAGAYALVSPSLHMSQQTIWGLLLGILAAFFYTGYLLATTHVRRNLGAFTSMALSTGSSTAAFLCITAISGESFAVYGATEWSVLLGLALISHVIGQGLITYALPYLPMTLSSAALIIQPIIAAVASWVIFGESLTFTQLLGISVALGGLYLIRRTTL